MFRARIALAAAVLVAALTAVVVSSLSSKLNEATKKQVESTVERAAAAFPKLDLLRGIELTNETSKLAREEEFGDIFSKNGDDQRQAAFVAVQARNARLEQAGRKADLIAVVGPSGHVVVRDLNINAMFDEDLKAKYPSVGKALDGVANKDVWSFNGSLYRVGAAPIRGKSGQIAGALVVGYVASTTDAMGDKDKLGTEVAYFLDKKVQASSWKKQGGESEEEKQLTSALFTANLADPALKGEVSKPFQLKINGEDYVGAVGPLPGNMTKSPSGYVVVASLSAARAPYAAFPMWIMILGVVGLLAAVGAAVLTAMRFLMPLDAIERGVAEVINGNQEYTFESPSQDFEGLANGLNVMIARLTGRPDPTDDELGDGDGGGGGGSGNRWGGELAVEQNITTGPQTSPENIALAQEEEGAYLQRTFDEWVAACKANNEQVSMDFNGFVDKLKKSEASLKAKYSCKAVRFKVVVKNNQTTLKPVPIA
jgi:hypothetical protein